MSGYSYEREHYKRGLHCDSLSFDNLFLLFLGRCSKRDLIVCENRHQRFSFQRSARKAVLVALVAISDTRMKWHKLSIFPLVVALLHFLLSLIHSLRSFLPLFLFFPSVYIGLVSIYSARARHGNLSR